MYLLVTAGLSWIQGQQFGRIGYIMATFKMWVVLSLVLTDIILPLRFYEISMCSRWQMIALTRSEDTDNL